MEALLEVIRRTWGHAGFPPLQREAMRASLEGRDALVVLPTGGGKSLCCQAPALLAGGLTVVVSPLISLMEDQVDRLAGRLRESGVRAVGYHAGMEAAARAEAQDRWGRGEAYVVAAMVAFGMGIDQADVRFVIHAGMPQSLELYQQQAGRAGGSSTRQRPANHLLPVPFPPDPGPWTPDGPRYPPQPALPRGIIPAD